MSATLRQVALGIETRLKTITGLRTYSHIVGDPQPPAAMVIPPPITYEGLSLSQIDGLPFGVAVIVSANLDRKQLDLYEYQDVTGPKSIPAAIHADRTLGLAGVDAFVARAEPGALDEVAGYPGFGLSVQVMVRIS